MKDIGSTLFLVFVLVAVLVGAYYTTRFLSGKARQIMKSKHIHVLDRMGLAKDKALFLTKVGSKCFFIGVTNQTVSLLGEIKPEDLESAQPEPPLSEKKGLLGKFSDILANAKNAPENFRKAREKARQAKDEKSNDPGDTGFVDDDYIDQISRAIEQRKAAKPGSSEESK